MNVGMPDIEILNSDELKAWFVDQYQRTPAEVKYNDLWFNRCKPVYVSSNVRREYLLQHKNILIGGRFYTVDFEDMKGGVWKATLVKDK